MSKQVILFVCGGRKPSPQNIAELALSVSEITGDAINEIVVKHFDEDALAKLCVRESMSVVKSQDKEQDVSPIREALKFIAGYRKSKGNITDIEFGFVLRSDLEAAKGRVAFNPSSADSVDNALISAVEILCEFDVNPNDLRKYGVSKSTLNTVRYASKFV